MVPQGSVTRWIELLKAGESEAVKPLLDRYLKQLETVARRRLQGVARGAADEEDVALSAFDSFCRGVERGTFPRLTNRDELRSILVKITACKAVALRQREGRQKRGGGKVFSVGDLSDEEQDIVAFLSREPTPESTAELAEEWQRRIELLPSEQLRAVALEKLEGYTNAEIAVHQGCAVRTVERRLRLIRTLLSQENQG